MILLIFFGFIVAMLIFEKQMMSLIAILTGNKEILREAGSLCDSVPQHYQLPERKKIPEEKWRQMENGIWTREI